MTDISRFVASLKKTYPLPEVDPAWVREIVQALKDAGGEVTVDDLHTQYLHSDLALSTLESRAIPPGNLHNRILFPHPTLLQIHAIFEVGSSAFQIQTVMEQRSEVLSGASRIRRLDDDEDEEADEDDGKVPPYPRGMLRLEVGDGRRTMRAMEYKRIGQLVLGQTSLGCKLLVQNVRCLGDILLLSPDDTQVIESFVEHLEALQRVQFVNHLKRRMGKLEIEEADLPEVPRPIPQVEVPRAAPRAAPAMAFGTAPAQPQPQLSAAAIARRRALGLDVPSDPPPAYQNQPNRPHPSRPAQAPQPSSSPPPIVKPTPVRRPSVRPTPSASSSRKPSIPIDQAPSFTPRKSTRAAGKAASARVEKLYQLVPEVNYDIDDEFDAEMDEADLFDGEADESFFRHIDEVEAGASKGMNGPRRTSGYDTDDEDVMFLDESMIRQLDHVEALSSNTKQETSRNTIKRFYDPDEDEDEVNEEDGEVDESFIRHVDAAEAMANTIPPSRLKIATAPRSSASTSVRSSGQSTRSKPSQKRRYVRDGDSQKENQVPEIIVISD
ncbi:hypothetical protein IAR55_003441 [Kwoniella newhampshirensis]|uniref:RecQ-mediated genome instability protein 1 n=1 Tax=Kwoniella newhampshirensis TaxID=1651941 RepID=A0AAW0YMG2_9TREE